MQVILLNVCQAAAKWAKFVDGKPGYARKTIGLPQGQKRCRLQSQHSKRSQGRKAQLELDNSKPKRSRRPWRTKLNGQAVRLNPLRFRFRGRLCTVPSQHVTHPMCNSRRLHIDRKAGHFLAAPSKIWACTNVTVRLCTPEVEVTIQLNRCHVPPKRRASGCWQVDPGIGAEEEAAESRFSELFDDLGSAASDDDAFLPQTNEKSDEDEA